MEDDVLAVVIYEGAVFDSLVLFFEIGDECWAVAAALIGVSLEGFAVFVKPSSTHI